MHSTECKTAQETRAYLAGKGGIRSAFHKHSLDAMTA